MEIRDVEPEMLALLPEEQKQTEKQHLNLKIALAMLKEKERTQHDDVMMTSSCYAPTLDWTPRGVLNEGKMRTSHRQT